MNRGSTRARRPEVPTLLLAAMIYGGWLALTWWHAAIPLWATIVAGGWLIAWHGSLQHETIHGHPTARRWLNGLIGGVPLALWLPYAVYRRTHLAHHRTEAITDPFDDPESRYLTGRENGAVLRLARLEASLLGRLLIGPPLAIARFLIGEARRAVRSPRAAARDWLPHLGAASVVLLWLHLCDFGIGAYLLCCVYPGTALTLLRSFAEHRAGPDPRRCVAIVEDRGALALLYLHNNLHAAHHQAPGLPWFALPAFYRRHRRALIEANGGLVYRGYGEVARLYLLRAHDRLVHPDHA